MFRMRLFAFSLGGSVPTFGDGPHFPLAAVLPTSLFGYGGWRSEAKQFNLSCFTITL